jgi:hypothetical protein
MSDTQVQMCIFPGCERPAVPAHEMGGPQPHFCDSEEHNAGSAFNERKRLDAQAATGGEGDESPA